jgi:hypothetical protein
VLKENDKIVVSHTFVGLSIFHRFFARRCGVRSLMVGTLLSALRTQDETIPEVLSHILRTNCEHNILVSTTRVPDFSHSFQNPAHGYRSLGQLSAVNCRESAPSTSLNYHKEILAIDAVNNNPLIQSFYNTWKPFGINLKTHFLLIFTARSSSVGIFPFSSARYSLDYRNPLTGHPSPSSATQSMFEANGHWVPLTITSLEGVPTDSTIEEILNIYSISPAIRNAAVFRKYDKSLFSMVNNYTSMTEILTCLSLNTKDKSLIVYTSGKELRVQEVLEHFQWTYISYDHKHGWYTWAQMASQRLWNGEPPGMSYNYTR